MSIPDFDHNNVLPPYLNNPTNRSQLSPYKFGILEVCEHFATTTSRVEILKGLLSLRGRLNALNVHQGFQWLDGSFMENIEKIANRPPSDIDVVTFYAGISHEDNELLSRQFDVSHPHHAKERYLVDHYMVDFAYCPLVTVEETRYWLQLFTHSKRTVWKGIIQVQLHTPNEDNEAIKFLNSLSL